MSQSSIIINSIFLMLDKEAVKVSGYRYHLTPKVCTPTEVINQEIRNTHINIGTGIDISIKELAETIKEIVGFKGEL